MSKFEFIQELSEAKLFKNPTKLSDASIGQVADSFFNAILGLQILRHTDPKAAQRYAKQSLAYSNLNDWRSSGSDLHNMAHILSNVRRYENKLSVDRKVTMPQLQYKQYLKNIAAGKEDLSFDRKFLFNLQRYLGVQSAGLRSARRLIGDWNRALPNEKQLASTRVYYGLQHDLRNSDMFQPFSRTVKRNKLLAQDAEIPAAVNKGLPLWQKMAIAGVAGYVIGKKLGEL